MLQQLPLLPLAITLGEPAGIGPDVLVMALSKLDLAAFPNFIIGDIDVLQSRASALGISLPAKLIPSPLDHDPEFHGMQVLSLSAAMTSLPGKPSNEDGKLVIEAIETAVEAVFSGQASGLVTAPINKDILYSHGFEFPGHTEMLADLAHHHTGQKHLPVMMIACEELRTVPVTIHIPLMDVGKALSKELIIETAHICARDLQNRFGILNPRLAISGLNPHAGENGAMGLEDEQIIVPAISALKEMGIDAVGPLPADTMFHARARANYDVAICMYHDQALIPAKTIGFDDGVNVTLGLPFIRTSPDHGTAFEIAGTDKANPGSMIAAIKLAGKLAGKLASKRGGNTSVHDSLKDSRDG